MTTTCLRSTPPRPCSTSARASPTPASRECGWRLSGPRPPPPTAHTHTHTRAQSEHRRRAQYMLPADSVRGDSTTTTARPPPRCLSRALPCHALYTHTHPHPHNAQQLRQALGDRGGGRRGAPRRLQQPCRRRCVVRGRDRDEHWRQGRHGGGSGLRAGQSKSSTVNICCIPSCRTVTKTARLETPSCLTCVCVCVCMCSLFAVGSGGGGACAVLEAAGWLRACAGEGGGDQGGTRAAALGRRGGAQRADAVCAHERQLQNHGRGLVAGHAPRPGGGAARWGGMIVIAGIFRRVFFFCGEKMRRDPAALGAGTTCYPAGAGGSLNDYMQ